MNRRLQRQLSRNPELRDLLKRHPAFTAELTRGGHWCIRHSSGEFFYAAATPSDWRSIRKVEADMRRIERAAS